MAEPSVVMMAIQRVVPALRITNYERSKKFYLDQLGFILEWEHRFEPTFPVFMSVALDGMRLYRPLGLLPACPSSTQNHDCITILPEKKFLLMEANSLSYLRTLPSGSY